MTLKHPVGTKLKHTAYGNVMCTVIQHLEPSKNAKTLKEQRERYLIQRGEKGLKTRVSEKTVENEYEVVP